MNFYAIPRMGLTQDAAITSALTNSKENDRHLPRLKRKRD